MPSVKCAIVSLNGACFQELDRLFDFLKNASSLELSKATQTTFPSLSIMILPEASRYSSIDLNVWYITFLGSEFQSAILVGGESKSLTAFSTITIVSRVGECLRAAVPRLVISTNPRTDLERII